MGLDEETQKLFQHTCQGYIGVKGGVVRSVDKHVYLAATPAVVVDGKVSHGLCAHCAELYEVDLQNYVRRGE